MMESVFQGALLGIIATVGMDIWAAAAKYILHLPTANWAMVGRWLGHMPRGVFVHHPVAEAAAIPNELLVGWIGHYTTGVAYGIAYLWIVVEVILSSSPSLTSALVFGVVTLGAPWLIMQPAMGAGVFATGTPRPAVTRLMNLSMHGVFGLCLYLGWLLISGT